MTWHIHRRRRCRPKAHTKAAIKLRYDVRKWPSVRLHSSQRTRAVSVSESWQRFHSLTTQCVVHVLMLTWLTLFWCAECIRLRTSMIFYHGHQLTYNLEPLLTNQCNNSERQYLQPNQVLEYVLWRHIFVRCEFFTSLENLRNMFRPSLWHFPTC